MALCHRKPQTQSSTWQTLGDCRHISSLWIYYVNIFLQQQVWDSEMEDLENKLKCKKFGSKEEKFLLFWIDSTWNLRARKEKVHTLYRLIKYDRVMAECVTGTASAHNAAQFILELIKMCSLHSLIITYECTLVIQLNNVRLHQMMYIKQFKNVHLLLKLWTDSAVGYEM